MKKSEDNLSNLWDTRADKYTHDGCPRRRRKRERARMLIHRNNGLNLPNLGKEKDIQTQEA